MRWASAASCRGRPQARFDPAVETSHGSPVVSASSRGRPHWPPCRHRCQCTAVQPFAAIRRLALDSLEAPSEAASGRARPRAAVHQRVLTCRVSTPTAMKTLTRHFESRVGAFLERTGVMPPTFGLQAVGYLNPVRQLRPGRSPTLAVACQVPVSIEPAAGPKWPLFPPGATRPAILHRTERRQTDDESNGTGHGRARARPEVTSSAGPHRGWRGARSTCGWPTGAFPNRSG